jgi:MFS superfamily sulfate permease-like transporter
MEASKSAAPAANRPSVALDIVRLAGASILAGLVTAAVAAAVVILLSGSGDASSDAPTVPASSTPASSSPS